MEKKLINKPIMNKKIAYILFFIATVIWGFAFIAQKQATLIPAFTVGMLRSLLASLFIFALIPFTDRLTNNGRGLSGGKGLFDINKHEIIGGLVLGVIITVATSFQQYGLADTDAGKAAFITALYVVIVPIMSTFLGKKPSITSVIAIPIAIIGFYLLCIKQGARLELSDVLVLICALIFAGHIVCVDKLSVGCDGVRMSLIQFVVAFVLNGILALIFDRGVNAADILTVAPSLLYLGICSSGIAYTLQIVGQKEADPTVSSVILSLESVFGVIGAAMILGEQMEIREYIGCAIVFVAVLLAQTDPKIFLKKRSDENE